MKVQEKGPWRAHQGADGKVDIQSDDFHHDAALYVTGDFESKQQRYAYGEEIARRLNLQNPGRNLSTGEAVDLIFKGKSITLKSTCKGYDLYLAQQPATDDERVVTIKNLGSGYKQPLRLSSDLWESTRWINSAEGDCSENE